MRNAELAMYCSIIALNYIAIKWRVVCSSMHTLIICKKEGKKLFNFSFRTKYVIFLFLYFISISLFHYVKDEHTKWRAWSKFKNKIHGIMLNLIFQIFYYKKIYKYLFFLIYDIIGSAATKSAIIWIYIWQYLFAITTFLF